MIQPLFAPAIALLNRLGYTKKFTLLWLLSLLAIAVVVYSLFVSVEQVIAPSQRELEGLALIKPITETIQAVQLHRGIAAALLSGNESMRQRAQAQEKIATARFTAMAERLPAALAGSEHFRAIRAGWARLHQPELYKKREESFAAHTDLIEQLQLFAVLIADEYLLTLDPEIASFYLIDTAINKLPHVLEHLGQLRAYGTAILTERKLSGRQRMVLQIQMAELNATLYDLRKSFDKINRYHPLTEGSYQAMAVDIYRSAEQISALVDGDLLSERFATPAETFLQLATTAIDNSYAQIYDTLLPAVALLIDVRIARAKGTLFMSGGVALLMFVLVVYLSVSLYYAIINNIRSLAHSARTFAGGNLSVRARLDTRDELSVVADSFNEMADGFNAMLEARLRAEELLLKESYKNQTLLRAASDGIHILDLQGNVVQVNDAFCRMLGYSAGELAGMNAAQWDTQWTQAQIREQIGQLADEGVMLETRHRRRDGTVIDVEVSVVRVAVDGNMLVYCSSRDVTQRKQAEQALRENELKLHTVIETALDALVQVNNRGVITGWNSQAERIFGWPRATVIGKTLSETIIPPQYRKAHEEGMAHFLATGEGTIMNSRIELLGLHRDGHEFPVELSITAIHVSGEPEFNGFIRDISRQKASEALIWRQANFDTLTGLPNRHMLLDRLTQELKKAQRADLKAALLFIDLDKFKEVNDTLGHSKGDLLLQEAARRISYCVREVDTVARLGGDEFIVILAELEDSGSVERIAGTILQQLIKSFSLGNEVVYVSASIGITIYPDDAADTEALLRSADQAMYAAKNAGRNRFSYFMPAMQQAAQERLRLSNELRGALAAGQLSLHYQPIVTLAGGGIVKAEALLRWHHPERGMVSPAQFIPLAEESGMIVEIGDWVFREAARQVLQWRGRYHAGFQISVNVSPLQLGSQVDSGYHQAWFGYLRELGLPGQSVVIEITEGLLLAADGAVAAKLLEFRDAGVQVAIDDFGTGYSSLSYLKKFDIDYLKIDQSFVRNLQSDANDMALSEAIIVMAHKLGLQVIAEGVETQAQRQLLADAGCDYAQGYLFSRPLPVVEFERLLESADGR